MNELELQFDNLAMDLRRESEEREEIDTSTRDDWQTYGVETHKLRCKCVWELRVSEVRTRIRAYLMDLLSSEAVRSSFFFLP